MLKKEEYQERKDSKEGRISRKERHQGRKNIKEERKTGSS
jgi:hypothetical protein